MANGPDLDSFELNCAPNLQKTPIVGQKMFCLFYRGLLH